MSLEAIGAPAPEPAIAMDIDPALDDSKSTTGLHSPPDSNNALTNDGSDSELSDIDEVAEKLENSITIKDNAEKETEPQSEPQTEHDAATEEKEEEGEEDIGEVLPDHWSGTVPVFKPTFKQFQDFKLFMTKVDKYGMKSGIIKIIPPQEWKDSLPELDDMVKQVRVREPIKQEIMGSNGTYRQVNILHQRSYNLPQWRQLCEQSEHQPPARRGERRANAERKPATRSRAAAPPKPAAPPAKKRRGRPPRASTRARKVLAEEDDEEQPMTPVSPPPEKEEVMASVEDPGVKEEDDCDDEDQPPVVRRMGFTRQSKAKTQSVSARRKYIRREGSAMIDEKAFQNWDYRMDVSEFTPERCEELERIYWKTLTYASPLYGADLLGTMFSDDVKIWNLNKLPNLLDVLGTKVPGVNTAYLYLGMWKATFAWHLEDVDLYSINYLHFGAPKQWYSISQADARRFEAAMKNIWPTDAKACDQFLRHKGYLISPAHLKQHYNITVNKCVSYPGEFVVTYPYGYHSGYNLGYNCAEAVNFALDSWLPMGKIAKRCTCAQAQDSVWVDVYEIERKLRGEETEYEETEDEDEEEEDDEDNETGLPSPPSSHTVRIKGPGRKRKRGPNDKESSGKIKKARLRIKSHVEPPCCLCPNDIPGAEIMATDDGRKAHRMCALYLPETYIETVDDQEIVANAGNIDKARLELKCLYCRSKKGACFQCSQKKCPRSYHATCAAAAGVFVEESEVPVFGDDGTEYKEQAFEFSCRFHRTKRDRKLDGAVLENDPRIREAAAALKKNDICQLQYFRGEIFAGVVVENRADEETLLLDIIPNGDRVELEWKWLLVPDPADLRLPKASANAIPMPTCRKAQQEINAKRAVDEAPRKDDEFGAGFVWAEFHAGDPITNRQQVKVDFSKENQVWHYLGKTSTEAKAQYTGDPSKPQHNFKSNFLDSIPKPVSAVPVPLLPQQPKRALPATYPPARPVQAQYTGISAGPFMGAPAPKHERPYTYKPRTSMEPSQPLQSMQYMPHQFAPKPTPPQPLYTQPQYQPIQITPMHQHLPQRLPVSQPTYQHQVFQPPLAPHQPPQPQPPQAHQPLQFQQQQQPSLHVKHYQPPLNQQKSSSDRFAPVGGSNGFPQLPGLSWPPAHMKSGHYSQPPSRVWDPSADAAAHRPPMTSSSSNPSGSGHVESGVAEGQPQVDAYQKYSFFQVNHNRDPVRYRTPYGPGGGFVNGYERNHRAFLIKAQKALNGGNSKPKTPSRAFPNLPHLQPRPSPSPQPNHRPQVGYSSPYAQILPRRETSSPQSPFSFENGRAGPSQSPVSPYIQQAYSVPTTPGSASCAIPQPGSTPLHPAINLQYGAPVHQETSAPPAQHTWTPTAQMSTTAPPSRQAQNQPSAKSTGFHKQSHSPIPLPPYVRNIVGSGTATNTPKPKPSPLSRPPEQAVPKHIAPAETQNNTLHQYSPQNSPGFNAMQNNPFSNSQAGQGSTHQHSYYQAPSPAPPVPSPTMQQQPPYYQPAPPPPQQPTQPQTSVAVAGETVSQPAPAPEDTVDVERMLVNLRRASMSLGGP
ncbi:hypothetical protein QBC35DRAFT_379288 [Podospora australis]|uniref:[histone H3]-trimethyl-L-lysine(9) demethylase n=1 Tax=Podospora australis TaxID=1536484 RepID=A0AAN6WX11_9PEZI|nr:hypothetical protein QBC35DRAFT_379288 [Podospora australis]